jgi:hypothetical protein
MLLFLSVIRVKYIDNAASAAFSHIDRYRKKSMFTLKLFEGWTKNMARASRDKDLETWARIEYKKDSEYAYNYIREHGIGPSVGVQA